MSKLNADHVAACVNNLLAFSRGEEITVATKTKKGKKRNFVETIELQIGLKNYSPSKDKRFNGSFVLPTVPRPGMQICILATQEHLEEAKEAGIDAMTVDDLKKLNKNKKLVKKLAKKYDAFLASHSLIKQIPRYLGPGLNRAGKFPTAVAAGESVASKVTELRSTVKFQMKKVVCMNAAVGNVEMDAAAIIRNVNLSVNFLVSLLKKGWQNVNTLVIKSTMGPPFSIYF